MYYEYWGLNKHAFDNVPDPSMYFDQHRTCENAVAELLFAIEEGDECLAVVIGEVGLGKTMALRVVLDSLDPERYEIAFITNPDLTFPQILRETVGQLTNTPCTIAKRDQLLEQFNRILFETNDMGKKVVVFIDEGNAIKPANLESLRLLTNLQEDTRNLFTLVLAGQPELARRLEHPKRANLFQRIGVYCRIDRLDSRNLVKKYMEHRLLKAGLQEKDGKHRQIFTDKSIDYIWEYSDHGVPRLINKICKLSLKAGETNELAEINENVVIAIGDRFRRMTRVAASKRKSRKYEGEEVTKQAEPELIPAEEAPKEEIIEPAVRGGEPIEEERALQKAYPDEFVTPPEEKGEESKVEAAVAEPIEVPAKEEKEAKPAKIEPAKAPAEKAEKKKEKKKKEPAAAQVKEKQKIFKKAEKEKIATGKYGIPASLIEHAKTMAANERLSLAGQLAAKTMKENSEKYESFAADPVDVWAELRKEIAEELDKLCEAHIET